MVVVGERREAVHRSKEEVAQLHAPGTQTLNCDRKCPNSRPQAQHVNAAMGVTPHFGAAVH
jgi:hypothetical protein